MEIGKRIRSLRKQKGLTLKELASDAKISIGFLGDIESGRSKPSVNTLNKLANSLDTTTDILLGNEKPDQPQTDDFLKAKDLGESLKQVAEISYKLGLSKEEQYKLWEKAIEKYGLPKIDTSVNDEEAAHLDKDIPGTGAFKESSKKK